MLIGSDTIMDIIIHAHPQEFLTRQKRPCRKLIGKLSTSLSKRYRIIIDNLLVLCHILGKSLVIR